jgi:hypothetical protein
LTSLAHVRSHLPAGASIVFHSLNSLKLWPEKGTNIQQGLHLEQPDMKHHGTNPVHKDQMLHL